MVTIKHFTASWCQPCKQLTPIMKSIVSNNSNINYQIIDVDNDPVIAQKYGVRSVPFVVFEKNGIIREQIVGLMSKSYYESVLLNIS